MWRRNVIHHLVKPFCLSGPSPPYSCVCTKNTQKLQWNKSEPLRFTAHGEKSLKSSWSCREDRAGTSERKVQMDNKMPNLWSVDQTSPRSNKGFFWLQYLYQYYVKYKNEWPPYPSSLYPFGLLFQCHPSLACSQVHVKICILQTDHFKQAFNITGKQVKNLRDKFMWVL